MTVYRKPKRPHSDFMCYMCLQFEPAQLDWGFCIVYNEQGDILIKDCKYAYEPGCGFGCNKYWFKGD